MKLFDPHPDRPGWWYEIVPMLFGKYRIVLTDGRVRDDNW